MSWRSTDEWPDDRFVVSPSVIEESLAEAASPAARRSPGEGRRMRKLGRTFVAVLQVALLAAMVLVPAGTFAGKPAADPAASTTQVESGKGKSAEAKAKKGSTDTQTAPTTDAKPGKGNGGAEKAPPKKGSGSETKGKSSEKGKSGEKGAQGQGKKAEAAAAETTVAAASGEPTITSDKADYPPGAKVVLTGSNWQGDEPSGVEIIVNDDAGKSWSRGVIVDVAKDGTITDRFRLPDWFAALYTVTATGLDTGRVATTTFTDASIGTYDQCSNDDGDGFGGDPGDCNWINGNLNANNSTYQEGDATVQRLWLTGFVAGSTHSVTFQYGTTKSGTHAYDFLTTWDWSEDWISLANRCEDITGCETAAETTVDMGNDSDVPDTIETGLGGDTRQFVMRGGTLTDGGTPTLASGAYGGGDSETAVTVSFTVASSGSMCTTKGQTTTCAIALWFGAHIAKTDDWVPVDTFGGATQIPGSPYHVSLEAIDGLSAGQRDNQMQTGAVINPFNLIIVKNTIGGNDTFDYTVVGAGLNDFSIITSGNTGTHEFLDLEPGTADRSVTEDPPPPPDDWTFTSLNCAVTVNGPGTTTFIIGGQTVTVTESGAGDTLTCTYVNTLGTASLTITKTPSQTDVCNGSSVTYTYVVTNTGAVGLTVNLDDDVLGDIDGGAGFALGAGQSQTFTASGSVTGEVTNTVTATGTSAGSQTATATASATVTGHVCTISITKVPDETDVCDGSTVGYTIVVTNNSPEFSWTGSVIDDVLGTLAASVTIAAGDSVTYTPSGAVTGVVTNIVTADGAFDDVDASAASDTATATVTGHVCTISITKVPDETDVCDGSTVGYTIVVTNNSPEFSWTGSVIDDVLGTLAASVTIAAGDSVTYTPSGAVTGVVTNIVTADGAFDDVDASAASDTATATVTGHVCTISITKVPDETDVCDGSTVGYTIVVTNNSPEFSWTGSVIDDVLGTLAASVTIAAGDSVTYTPSGAVTGVVTNIVTADGAFDDVDASAASDTATATVTGHVCTISITKVPDETDVCDGSTVGYTIVVTNNSPEFSWTGSVIDDVLGTLAASVTIAAGDSVTYTPSGAVTGVVTNIVTADGAFDDVDASAASDTATATVTGHVCTISLTKTPDQTEVCNGTTVTYTYVITNDSDEFIWTGTLTDDVLGAINGTIMLDPGESETFTASGPVTGTVHNTATAAGAFDDPATTSAGTTADATVIGHECGQGCTPGFWQGGVGIQLWNLIGDTDWTSHGGAGTNPFIQSQSFVSFFPSSGNTTVDNMSMLAIVGSGGTNVWPRKAARDLIAAYLNRSFLGSSYPYSLATILADWTLAVSQGTDGFKSFHTKYDAANNLGCPISNTLIQ